jgi:hypothetical protein
MLFDDKRTRVWICHAYAKKDAKGGVQHGLGNSGDHPELSSSRMSWWRYWMFICSSRLFNLHLRRPPTSCSPIACRIVFDIRISNNVDGLKLDADPIIDRALKLSRPRSLSWPRDTVPEGWAVQLFHLSIFRYRRGLLCSGTVRG